MTRSWAALQPAGAVSGGATIRRIGLDVAWSRVAVDLGYGDQSHMIAEFREFRRTCADR